jgi:hypothetical protein
VSIPGERSSAAIEVICGDEEEGDRSLAVLRPVPHPSSVIVIGRSEGRRVKTKLRSAGSITSSTLWSMLPSVS